MLGQLLRATFSRSRPEKEKFAPLWIDTAAAPSRLTKFTGITQKALNDLRENGLAVIPSNVPGDLCDAVVAAFEDFCRKNTIHEQYRDKYGLHDRLCNLQITYEKVADLALNATVLRVLESALDAKVDIVGSLFFERGSEQDIHRDSPAFYTIPLNHYFGVWHALEDIHPDSGMLSYYPGGHRIAPDRDFLGSGQMEQYFTAVERECQRKGIQRTYFAAKKGDTLIWHPQLPHGGSTIKDPTLSRRSIVFHYKQFGLPIYGAPQFFGPQELLSTKDNFKYLKHRSRRILDHGQVVFQHNRKEGNFDQAG